MKWIRVRLDYPKKEGCEGCGGTGQHFRGGRGVSINDICPAWAAVFRENNRRNNLARGRARADSRDLILLRRAAREHDQANRRIRNAETNRSGA